MCSSKSFIYKNYISYRCLSYAERHTFTINFKSLFWLEWIFIWKCWAGNIRFSVLHCSLEFTVVSCEVSSPNQKSGLMTKKMCSLIRSTDFTLWLGSSLPRPQNLFYIIRKITLPFYFNSAVSTWLQGQSLNIYSAQYTGITNPVRASYHYKWMIMSLF